MHYLGTTAARLKLKEIAGGLVYSGGACGLICLYATNLTCIISNLHKYAIVFYEKVVSVPAWLQ